MRLSLCGRIRIERGGALVEEHRLGGCRARLAFAVLVLERRAVDRHFLAEVLWPDGLPETWEPALRVVVSRIRAFLSAAGMPASDMLTCIQGHYRLTLPEGLVVDVEEAAAAVEAAEAARTAGDHERAANEARVARSITSRTFLAGSEGEWVERVRRRLSALRVRALDALARAAIERGDPALAIEAAQELLVLDPYRDASHVLVMEAHRAAGNRAEALRAYGRFRQVLGEDLGVDPSPETEALYRSLLREEHGDDRSQELVWSASEADLPPNNLPAPLSTFVGRDGELREIVKLLEGDRLITLTGPAGAGKTRLAIEVARRALSSHPDGTWFVDLATMDDDALVGHSLAAAIGVVQQPPRDLVDTLVDHLRHREVILVLDNCEHLLATCATVVESLLRQCPLLWVLTTSREPLGVPGEVVWRVPSLAVPGPGVAESMAALLEFESVRLFVDRSRALRPEDVFTDDDAGPIAQICRRLDGIPLAIELAAACVLALSPAQIASRLDDRFRLLVRGARTAQARHQTLQRAVEWSHELLTPKQKTLFRRLAVFAGGWTLEAAEEIGCHGGEGAIDRAEVLDLLVALVNKSLVVRQAGGREARYGFLETLRHFARDRLVDAGEEEDARDAHLRWCARLVEVAERELIGADQAAWFGKLDAEIGNIRGALEWAGRPDRRYAEAGLRMAGALTLYWHVRGLYSEGLRQIEIALAGNPGTADLLRAKALWGLGFMAFYLGDVPATVSSIEESLRLARAAGAKQETGRALAILGELASLQDPAAAHHTLEESASLARDVGDDWCLSYSLASRAWTDLYKGIAPAGRPFAAEAVAVARRANDTRNLLRGSLCLAWAGLLEGDFRSGGLAEQSLETGLELARRLGDIGWTGLMLNGQGELAWRRGDYERAGRLLRESLDIGRRLGSPYAIAPPAGLLGRLAKATGDLVAAAAWFEEALEISRKVGMHMFVPWWIWGRADTYRLAGDVDSSSAWLDEAMNAAESVGNEPVMAFTVWARACIARDRGQFTDASVDHRLALSCRRSIGDGAGILDSLESVAGLAAERGQPATAVRLFAAATTHRALQRCARPTADQARYDADLAAAKASLPADDFTCAWDEGQALSRDDAVALALGEAGQPTTADR